MNSMLPLNQVLLGDCRDHMKAFPADQVDLVATSPPYWSLRDYGIEPSVWGGDPNCEHEWEDIEAQDEGYAGKSRWQHGVNGRGEEAILRRDRPEVWSRRIRKHAWCKKCGAWKGCLGLEPDPSLYIEHLLEVARDVRRILKPSGSFWVNLGDSYCSKPGNTDAHYDFSALTGTKHKGNQGRASYSGPRTNWLQPKQLLLIPQRFAIAMQEEGWIVRNAAIWHKPNHMPESTEDRFTKSYENLYFLVKNTTPLLWRNRLTREWMKERPPKKYFHIDTKALIDVLPKDEEERKNYRSLWNGFDYFFDSDAIREPYSDETHAYGKNGSFEATVKNLKGADAWDSTLEERMQRGKGFRYRYRNLGGKNPGDVWSIPTQPFPGSHFAVFPLGLAERIVKACCPPRGVVYDPFVGSGTTLRAARKLGHSFIGSDISSKYVSMARKRVRTDSWKEPKGMKLLSELDDANDDNAETVKKR